ncbi:MAG: hypothetical protein AMJ73_00985 [candidate division Zixibacteria bacterium SM1_73]|nr:MAG: hypothetical protein AMJ73_00985 [candidate division Zixibacteria bacterium SM1_73]
MNDLWIILPAQTSEDQYGEDKCEVYTLKLECSPLGEPCKSSLFFPTKRDPRNNRFRVRLRGLLKNPIGRAECPALWVISHCCS